MASKSPNKSSTHYTEDNNRHLKPLSAPGVVYNPITQIGLTSHTHWGIEPTPEEMEAPKSQAEQIAKTGIGRVMQLKAEERVEDSEGYEFNETSENIHDALAELLNGTINLQGVRTLQDQLGDVVLSSNPDVRKSQLDAIQHTIDLINHNRQGILERDEQSKLEACPQVLSGALAQLSSLMDRARQALQQRNWRELNEAINPESVAVAHAIWAQLDLVRRNDPDQLFTLVEELKKGNPEHAHLYKRILVHFVENHNHFTFSQDLIRQINQKAAQSPANSFTSALKTAYINRPEQDNVFKFIEKTTRIPSNRLMEIMRAA